MSVTITRSGEKNLKRIMKNMTELKRSTIKVGFFEDSKYDDGTPVAYVAAIQEFGYPKGGIPSRSFMRSTAKEKKDEWAEITGQGVIALAEGKISAKKLGERLGGKAAGDVKKKIRSIKEPALSPVTLQLRHWKKVKPDLKITKSVVGQAAWLVAEGENVVLTGSAAKPLVDTGILFAAITYKVDSL